MGEKLCVTLVGFWSWGFNRLARKDKIIYQELHTVELSLRYKAVVGRERGVVYTDILTLIVPHG